MESDPYTFSSAAMSDAERDRLLAEAARQLDLLEVDLGGADQGVPANEESKLARALREDVAEFAGRPDVYPITDATFLSRQLAVPATFHELTKYYRFYWMYIPINLFPRWNWAFNRLELRVEFNADGTPPQLRPKAYQILPHRLFQTLLDVSSRIEIRLNENFEFSASSGRLSGQVGPAHVHAVGTVETRAAAGLNMIAGPFEYRIKRANIDHSPVGVEQIFWRLDGAQFFQEDSPPIVVIVQAPRATKTVSVDAELQAYRYFNLAAARLQEKVKNLPVAIRQFFTQGLPKHDTATWPDITAKL